MWAGVQVQSSDGIKTLSGCIDLGRFTGLVGMNGATELLSRHGVGELSLPTGHSGRRGCQAVSVFPDGLGVSWIRQDLGFSGDPMYCDVRDRSLCPEASPPLAHTDITPVVGHGFRQFVMSLSPAAEKICLCSKIQ